MEPKPTQKTYIACRWLKQTPSNYILYTIYYILYTIYYIIWAAEAVDREFAICFYSLLRSPSVGRANGRSLSLSLSLSLPESPEASPKSAQSLPKFPPDLPRSQSFPKSQKTEKGNESPAVAIQKKQPHRRSYSSTLGTFSATFNHELKPAIWVAQIAGFYSVKQCIEKLFGQTFKLSSIRSEFEKSQKIQKSRVSIR